MDGLDRRDAAALADLVSMLEGLVAADALDDRQRDALARALAAQESDVLGRELDALAIRLRAPD
jgi:hypothetical protein